MGKPHKKKLKPTYNGIVAAYELEGIASGMRWWDSAVGTRPNGIASGAPFPNWTGLPASLTPPPSTIPPAFDGVDDTCGTGQAYDFSAPTHLNYLYQEYGTHPVPMELPTTATVEAWVKPGANTGNRTFIGYHYLVRFGTKGADFNLWLSGIGDVTGPSFSVGSWYHFVVTYTYGGTFDLWVNGTKSLSAQAFVATHTPGRAWFLGNIQTAGWPYAGSIDTVRFYNRVLTDAEVIRNYKSGLRFHS